MWHVNNIVPSTQCQLCILGVCSESLFPNRRYIILTVDQMILVSLVEFELFKKLVQRWTARRVNLA
jgi:hypothetical protein